MIFGTAALIIISSIAVVPSVSSAALIDVVLLDNSFTPANVTVNVGDTVFWTNAGVMPHTVTADNGSFDSDTLQSGATYSISFDAPGTYTYHCKFHSGMTGIVTVLAVGNNTGSTNMGNAYTSHIGYQPPAGYGTGYMSYPATQGQVVQVPTGNVYNLQPVTYTGGTYSGGTTAVGGTSYGGTYAGSTNYPGVQRVNPYSYGNYNYPYPYPYTFPTTTATTTYPSYYPGTVINVPRYTYGYYPYRYGWNVFGDIVQPAATPISFAQKPSVWWGPAYGRGWGW